MIRDINQSGVRWWHLALCLLLIEALATGAIGTVLGDPSLWFQRWGAVIVLLSVVVITINLFSLDNHERWIGESRRQGTVDFLDHMRSLYRIDQIEAKAKSERTEFDHESVKLFSDLEKSHAAKLQDSRERYQARRTSLVLSEVSLLSLGTLQWGFGDLIANRYWLCGAWEC